jgi:hypothetical protein
METPERLSLAELAHVLFASPLQELDSPTPAQVRAAVSAALGTCGGDCSICSGYVAQEAGDHPDGYQRRMRWALATIQRVYQPVMSAAC